MAIWFSFSLLASRDLLAASLFLYLFAQYLLFFSSSGTNCFFLFLMIGWGLSSSSENLLVAGSKSWKEKSFDQSAEFLNWIGNDMLRLWKANWSQHYAKKIFSRVWTFLLRDERRQMAVCANEASWRAINNGRWEHKTKWPILSPLPGREWWLASDHPHWSWHKLWRWSCQCHHPHHHLWSWNSRRFSFSALKWKYDEYVCGGLIICIGCGS